MRVSDCWKFNHKWDHFAYSNKQNCLLETTIFFIRVGEQIPLTLVKMGKVTEIEGPNLLFKEKLWNWTTMLSGKSGSA